LTVADTAIFRLIIFAYYLRLHFVAAAAAAIDVITAAYASHDIEMLVTLAAAAASTPRVSLLPRCLRHADTFAIYAVAA